MIVPSNYLLISGSLCSVVEFWLRGEKPINAKQSLRFCFSPHPVDLLSGNRNSQVDGRRQHGLFKLFKFERGEDRANQE